MMYGSHIEDRSIMAIRLCCNDCGKSVSTPVIPVITKDNEFGSFVLRAIITCPECIEKRNIHLRNYQGYTGKDAT